MAVVLAPNEYPTWLYKRLTDPDQLKPLYQMFSADLLGTYPVSDMINSPRNNSPENIRKAVTGQ
jgi:putative SOS response-associated peptidase YedK